MVLYNSFQTNTPVASTNVLDGAEAARLRQANLDAYLSAQMAPRPMPQTGTGPPPVVTDFDKAGTEAGTRMNSAIDQGVANVRQVGSWGAGNQDAINQQVNAGTAQLYGQMAGLGQQSMRDSTGGGVADELAYQQQALANIGRSGNIYSDQMKQLSAFNAQSAEQAMNSSRTYNASAIEDQMNAGKRAAADAAASGGGGGNEKDPFSASAYRNMKYLLEQKAGKVDPTDWLKANHGRKTLKTDPNVWVQKHTNKKTGKETEKRVDGPAPERKAKKQVYHPTVEKPGKHAKYNAARKALILAGQNQDLLKSDTILEGLKGDYGKKWKAEDFEGWKPNGDRNGEKFFRQKGKTGGYQLYSYATGKPLKGNEVYQNPRIMQMIQGYSKNRAKYLETPDITDQQVRDAIQAQIDAGG